LQDAKFFKRQGLRLNKVEHFEFSAAYTKHWLALNKAEAAFENSFKECKLGISVGQWKEVKKRMKDLRKAMDGCHAFIGKAKNKDEANTMAWFLVNRAMPFVEYWQKAIATIDRRGTFKLNPDDVPPWIDDEE
jgi:hypothetical protein